MSTAPLEWGADAEVVQLAARRRKRVRKALLVLLAPHKVALLAVERASTAEAVRKVGEATTTVDMLRAARTQVRAGAVVAWKIAVQHVASEARALGLEPPTMPKQKFTYQDQLLKDLAKSLADPALSVEEKARRAGIAAAVSANRAYSDAQLAAYAAMPDPAKVRKVWAANFAAPTPPCAWCVKLDGVSVPLGEAFPLPAGAPPVYGGVLDAPPLHPHCRCRLHVEVVPQASAP